VLGCLGAITACSSPAHEPAVAGLAAPTAAPSMSMTGALPAARLRTALLQAPDLPGLPEQRPHVDATVTTEQPPQLGLCASAGPRLPHQSANLYAKGTTPGQATVFESVGVYSTAADADAVYAVQAANPTRCPSYDAGGTRVRVADLAAVPVPAPARAVHYRLVTPDVVSGDVRTLGVSGRIIVLISGYGRPPAGQTLLGYQSGLLAKALLQAGTAAG
jgi:hypothetical protein